KTTELISPSIDTHVTQNGIDRVEVYFVSNDTLAVNNHMLIQVQTYTLIPYALKQVAVIRYQTGYINLANNPHLEQLIPSSLGDYGTNKTTMANDHTYLTNLNYLPSSEIQNTLYVLIQLNNGTWFQPIPFDIPQIHPATDELQ